ncbi:MAG: MaoC family dehydratase [Chloroflexota bacterium]
MRYLEDLVAGTVYPASSVQLSEADILEFATRYDPQPFHVDPVAARRSPYGGLIASGWHTIAVTMRLIVDHVFNDAASLGSPGVDEIRWLVPVRPGDTLSPRVTIEETRSSRSKPDRGFLRFRVEVENQDGALAMTMVGTAMVATRPAAPG